MSTDVFNSLKWLTQGQNQGQGNPWLPQESIYDATGDFERKLKSSFNTSLRIPEANNLGDYAAKLLQPKTLEYGLPMTGAQGIKQSGKAFGELPANKFINNISGKVTSLFGKAQNLFPGSNNVLGNLGSKFGTNGIGVASIAGGIMDSVIKTPDNTSFAGKALDKASNIAMNINPVVGLSMKALSGINKVAGGRANKQITDGMNITGYATLKSPKAGQSFDALSALKKGGNRKDTNKVTKLIDTINFKSGVTSQNALENNLIGKNSIYDTSISNANKLFGGLNTNVLAAKYGTKISRSKLSGISRRAEAKKATIKTPEAAETQKSVIMAEGGKMPNVIPDGALHARKHNLPEEIAEQVTKKGIPVVSFEEGGEVLQHAEIEVNEIIFNKEATVQLETLFKEWNNSEDKNKKELELEAGKLLVTEILENTIDNTGLLNNDI